VDLAALAEAHAASGALVTLALVPNRAYDRYGGVVLDEMNRVTGFVPRGPSAEGSFHYIGVQLAHTVAFSAIRPGDRARTIGGIYDRLMSDRPGTVRGFVLDAAFWDVGTVADYWRTTRAFEQPDRSTATGTARIDPTAHVMDSILWDDVDVGARASVEHCILTDGVRIPEDATYRDSILLVRDDGLTAVPMPVA
jgi:NDP-sugar pyrophosphorylase family protein